MRIRAITLDLDDTLWPVWPTIERAERVLHEWLLEHAPRTARQYPIMALRALREEVLAEHPAIRHDFIEQRRLTLRRALRDSDEDENLVRPALELFARQRNVVELYPDSSAALKRLAARFPLAAITNGTASLTQIGLDHHFVFQIGAHEHGKPKPDASIFHAACERLGLAPGEVLHVGDHPEQDVLGAQRAGLRCAWINRKDARWDTRQAQPDFSVETLTALADRLEHERPPS